MLFAMVMLEEGPVSALAALNYWMKIPLLLVRWM
jgi:hypothetical protein